MASSPRLPTIADVAAAAGVSRTTVSMALNGKGRVDPDTRERIRRIADELAYRPSVRAQRLRGGRSWTIALVTALPQSIVGEASQLGFLLDLALPMAQHCLAHGYSLLLVPPLEDSTQLDVLDVDGAVVVDPVVNDPYCAALRSRGIRVVTIGAAVGADADGVVDRGAVGADVALDHLVARGAEHIAYIRSTEEFVVSATAERTAEETIARALPAALRIDVVATPVADGEQGGYRAMRQLLDRDDRPDAVYAPLDAFAIGALRAVQEAGLRVPEDVMVFTNFDGRRAAMADPPLTALDLDLPSLAEAATGLLLDILEDPSRTPVRVSVPPPVVIERASTARVPDRTG